MGEIEGYLALAIGALIGLLLGGARRSDLIERMRVIEREIPGYLSTRDR